MSLAARVPCGRKGESPNDKHVALSRGGREPTLRTPTSPSAKPDHDGRNYSESTFGAPMDIESLNGANGSMDPTSLDHTPTSCSSRTSSATQPPSNASKDIQDDTQQIAALDRFLRTTRWIRIYQPPAVCPSVPCLPLRRISYLPSSGSSCNSIPQGSSITPTRSSATAAAIYTASQTSNLR